MKKTILILCVCVAVSHTVFSQTEIANPKGSKGIIANFTNLDLGKQLVKNGDFDLSLGFSTNKHIIKQ